MKQDGFDMILNGCAADTFSIYKDGEFYQINICEGKQGGSNDFCGLLTRDELVELKAKIEMLLDFTR